jgi:uncharacterized protein YkwD
MDVPACIAVALCALLLAPPSSQLSARIDAARVARGKPRLAASAELARAASSHAQSMLRYGYFSHTSRDGTSFKQRLLRFYPLRGARSWRVGENLYWARGRVTADTIVEAWKRSPPHAQVLFDDWRQVGVAVVSAASAPGVFGGSAVTVVVADFGVRVS